MNAQLGIVVALGAIVVCSIAFAVLVPVVVVAAVRGNGRSVIRTAVAMAVLAVAVFALAVIVGSNPEAYSAIF